MGTPWNLLSHPNGSSYHENGLILNEGMSSDKAKMNIDTIMQYVIPRIMIQIGLTEISQTDLTTVDKTFVTIGPNPTKDRVQIRSNEDELKLIEVFDSNGNFIQLHNAINSNYFVVDGTNFHPGIYLLKIQAGEYVFCKKLIFYK